MHMGASELAKAPLYDRLESRQAIAHAVIRNIVPDDVYTTIIKSVAYCAEMGKEPVLERRKYNNIIPKQMLKPFPNLKLNLSHSC